MHLQLIDWLIVLATLLICFVPALFFGKRAGKNTSEFFASGRSVPWWLAGLSMVATTFSSDTPNWVTEQVRKFGVAGNWQWWAFVLTGVSTVFFFARLWRRSGVMTDLEFYELRYSGKAASVVRGFRAVYLGLFFNCFIMGMVTLAACKIANILFGLPPWQTIIICGILNVVFASHSGLWGVLVIDMVQFFIKMTAVVAAAYFSLKQVGGLGVLIEKLGHLQVVLPEGGQPVMSAIDGSGQPHPQHPAQLHHVPTGADDLHHAHRHRLVGQLVSGRGAGRRQLHRAAHAGLQVGEGFARAARCSSTSRTMCCGPGRGSLPRSARSLSFPIWPPSKPRFPNADPNLIGHDSAFPAMLKFLPVGFVGLMVGGLIAANSSTILTHLNWGSSYLVHDFYRRFINPTATEKHYVNAGRVCTVLLYIFAALLSTVMSSAQQAFQILLSIGAGTGLLYIVRWFWSRVSAWCEVTAMAASLISAAGFPYLEKIGVLPHLGFAQTTILQVGFTTICWLIAAFVAPQTERAKLIAFYKKVHPAGPGWTDVRKEAGVTVDEAALHGDHMGKATLGWVSGCAVIWSSLFAIGNFLYGRMQPALILTGVFVVSGVVLLWVVNHLWDKNAADANPALAHPNPNKQAT